MTTSSQAIIASTSNKLERTPPPKRWQLIITRDISALMRSFLNGQDLANLQAVDRTNHRSIMHSLKNQITMKIQQVMMKIQQPMSIQNSYWCAKELISIATIDPMHNLEPAKTIVKSMQEGNTKNGLVCEIVKAEAAWDLKAAEATAALISNPICRKDVALLEIVEAAATVGDLETMKRITALIQAPTTKDQALLAIVKAEAVRDLPAAKATVKLFGSCAFSEKNKALLAIVEAEAVHDLAAAKATAYTITGDLQFVAFAIIERAATKHKAN